MTEFIALSRKLDVAYTCDVAVIGGGPAGVAAATAAARAGAHVVLVEAAGCFGGMGTAGLVPCFCPYTDREKPVVRGIGEEVLKEMAERMGFPLEYDWMPIHAETLKTVYDDLLEASGAVCRLHTRAVDVIGGERIEAVVVATKKGPKAVKAKVFIDATGDGDVAAWAGVPFEIGDEEGRTMAPSLCPTYAGIDWETVEAHRLPSGERIDRATWTGQAERGETPYKEHHLPAGVLKVGEVLGTGNLVHVYGTDPLSEESLTRGMVEGRRMAWGMLAWYRANVPGYAKAEMAATAALLSVRESRRIAGEYTLTAEDYARRASFDDEIGRHAYEIDIHSSTTDTEEQAAVLERFLGSRYKPGESYGVPYRCLIARGKANLLVAGRAISTDRSMHGSMRVMPGCFVTGQGAGVAAAQAAAEAGGEVRKVNVSRLQTTLRAQGAYIPE